MTRRPLTVELSALQLAVDGQQVSPGKHRQDELDEAEAEAAIKAARAAKLGDFILRIKMRKEKKREKIKNKRKEGAVQRRKAAAQSEVQMGVQRKGREGRD